MTRFRFEPPPHLCVHANDRRLLGWLRDRLAARGVEAIGPRGRRLAIAAEDGLVSIGVEREGGSLALIVTRHGDAEPEYEETVAACDDALARVGLG